MAERIFMSNKIQRIIIKNSEFVSALITALLAKKKVKITGLGIFKIVHCKSRKTNPFGKGERIIKDYNKVKFTASQTLKDKINL